MCPVGSALVTEPEEFALSATRAGDPCPVCGRPLANASAILASGVRISRFEHADGSACARWKATDDPRATNATN